jgi:metal-dependent amidase/aminoacylase/carboxypeptidase family protein
MSAISDVMSGLQVTSTWQDRVYKDLHAHPELSFHETKTAAFVASKLKELGYEVLEQIGRTGVIGVQRNGADQTVLARADMDTVSVRENTGLPYASTLTAANDAEKTVSVAHACGHEPHVTCLLGASELLAKALQSWRGTFIALFQPAEEVAGGAKTKKIASTFQSHFGPDTVFTLGLQTASEDFSAIPAALGTPYTY